MSPFSNVARMAGVLALSIPLGACAVDTHDHPTQDGAVQVPTGSTEPLRVIIDTDQVMQASPGQGVGVFVEYQRGGTWHVWWTCDTARSGRPCNFDVGLSSPDGVQLVSATMNIHQPSSSLLDASTRTTNAVEEVTLTTKPGAVLTVEASVDGVRDPAFLFFVQKGQVNGGYGGALTNPLEFQGDLP